MSAGGLLKTTAGGAAMLALSVALRGVNGVLRFGPEALERARRSRRPRLFDAFPALADHVPWRPLALVPTPIEALQDPAPGIRLFVKRDDLTSNLYGGNKVRKLEFLLAEAELGQRRTLITLGGIGSNHALATAVHGRETGFEVDLVLYHQPETPFVRRNLGGFLAAGARLHYAGTTARAFLEAKRLFARRSAEGGEPYFIMVGGSSRLGCLGYVEAGFELAAQIATGAAPEPDLIFVPLGTTATAAGLVAGLRLAGLRSRVVAVRVADPVAANDTVVRFFGQDVLSYLRSCDPSVPRLRIAADDFDVLTDYIGAGYGHATPAAEDAVRQVEDHLVLETTYTGKTLAACLDRCSAEDRPLNVLFWNSYNSAPVPSPTSWAGLPPALRELAETQS